MNAEKSRRGPLLDHLDEIEARCAEGDVSLREIFSIFGEDGHYVIILFLILPFLQPIPLFGLSTPFGLLIATVTLLAYKGKPAHIPKRWADRKLKGSTVLRIAEGSERIFEKISFLLHPRASYMFERPFRFLSASLLVLNAILLALPLPIPFSNSLPAWMILFQALAHLEDDGIFVIISYVQTLVCMVYFVLVGLGLGNGIEFIGSKYFLP